MHLLTWLCLGLSLVLYTPRLSAQTADPPPAAPAVASEEDDNTPLLAPKDVEIEPLAEDSEIAVRLTDILRATTWFSQAEVQVDQGVVFLTGVTNQTDYRTWAGDLARGTQDVVAVVNRIQVTERSMWDLTPAWVELRKLGRETIQMLPLLSVAFLFILLTWFVAGWATHLSRSFLGRRLGNNLLIGVFSRATAIPVFLLGLYFALRVSGLTQMAVTVLGGTGLIGLVLGIAFRDIAENFLASVLISVQRPFALGDLIEVEDRVGIVQSVTARGTLLMQPDGNHIQIPNSIIYKSIIRNVTSNPNIRCDFVVGIDYADPIADAQQIILEVLRQHEAVLDNPDPMVLVEALGASTVNLRIYFWIDGHKHSPLKVRSSVIRLTKLAIEDGGLTMPDESREVIFPRGVPVRMLRDDEETELATEPSRPRPQADSGRSEVTAAENGLTSEQANLEEQGRKARNPESGENLLK